MWLQIKKINKVHSTQCEQQITEDIFTLINLIIKPNNKHVARVLKNVLNFTHTMSGEHIRSNVQIITYFEYYQNVIEIEIHSDIKIYYIEPRAVICPLDLAYPS